MGVNNFNFDISYIENQFRGPVYAKALSHQAASPTACSRRCKIHGIAVGSQGKFRKNVQFYLKILQVEMSRRPDGD